MNYCITLCFQWNNYGKYYVSPTFIKNKKNKNIIYRIS